jgi:hypothetical protein
MPGALWRTCAGSGKTCAGQTELGNTLPTVYEGDGTSLGLRAGRFVPEPGQRNAKEPYGPVTAPGTTRAWCEVSRLGLATHTHSVPRHVRFVKRRRDRSGRASVKMAATGWYVRRPRRTLRQPRAVTVLCRSARAAGVRLD